VLYDKFLAGEGNLTRFHLFSASFTLRLLIKKINNIFFSAAFYGILRGIKKGSEIFPETPVIKRCQK
jgi:hypothetical protein